MSLNKFISNAYHSADMEIRRISFIRQYPTFEATKTLLCAFVLSKLDYCNSLLSGCPLYILRRLQKVRNSAAKLVFKSRRRNHVQPLLQALHWLLVQARVDYKLSTICHDIVLLSHPLPTSLTFSLCTHLPDNFVLLQTHGHFTSSMLKPKPLANVLSLILLQSNGILSLLTSATFSPPMPSKLH